MNKKSVGNVFRVLDNIWDIILIVCIVAILLVRFATLPFGIEPVVCLSDSMVPAFYQGSMCYIDTRYDTSTAEVGDIVAFELSNGSQVTHRIHEITEDGFITKGDANEDPDFSPIREDQIIGENVFQIPYIGNLFYGFPNMIMLKLIGVLLGVKIILSVPASLLLRERGGKSEQEVVSDYNSSSSN